ncbi:MAG: hypothetical protein Ct9H300mP1_00210 [Planctomycetaceae bacterium]|nr:MAG: hypothetical protein Ct9H300mP1_00210 [Planctomycetaceae bacterium]
MQSSAPALMDLSGESKHTLSEYGVDPAKASFARNCLLARRLVERALASSSCTTPTGTTMATPARTSASHWTSGAPRSTDPPRRWSRT